MSGHSSAKIKSLMDNVYGLADDLDKSGISDLIPFVDPEEGLRRTISTDVLLFILKIIDTDKPICDECVAYLNECVGFSFTVPQAEFIRRKVVESELSQMCIVLPWFILLDKQLGGNALSSIYTQSLAYVALGYFRCQEYTSLEEIVLYYRYTTSCMELIEKALGEKVDFDPLDCIKSEHMEIIKYAVEADKHVNKRVKDPFVYAVEEALVSILSHEKRNTVEDNVAETDTIDLKPEILKDEGDGADLDDEISHDLSKVEHDGFALQDEGSENGLTEAMEELDALIGLSEVKQQIKDMVNAQKVRKRCEELNIKRPVISMHMAFTGKPGTGKTTGARIMGRM